MANKKKRCRHPGKLVCANAADIGWGRASAMGARQTVSDFLKQKGQTVVVYIQPAYPEESKK